MAMVARPMAMHIKLLKSMFLMGSQDIVIDLLVSLACVKELEAGTDLSMHHQTSNSLVIKCCFKAGSFNKS
jgi:hypothetical protein